MLETAALLLSLAGPVRPRPPAPLPTLGAEGYAQIKLRDLIDLLPRKDAAEALAEVIRRLVAIEEKLRVIEERLRAAPVPLPPVGPVGPAPLGRPR